MNDDMYQHHRKGKIHNEKIAVSEIMSMKCSPKILDIIISDYLTLKQKPGQYKTRKERHNRKAQLGINPQAFLSTPFHMNM